MIEDSVLVESGSVSREWTTGGLTREVKVGTGRYKRVVSSVLLSQFGIQSGIVRRRVLRGLNTSLFRVCIEMVPGMVREVLDCRVLRSSEEYRCPQCI